MDVRGLILVAYGKSRINMKLSFSLRKTSTIGFIVVLILMIAMLMPAILDGSINDFISRDDHGIDLKNFAIEDLTDEQIINISAHSSKYMSGVSRSGESTGVEGRCYSEADRDNVRYHAGKAVGIDTLITGKISSGTVTFDIDVELTSGAAQIVVIKDGEIVERMAVQDTTITYEVSEESTYIIKLLLEDAKIEINATRKITK